MKNELDDFSILVDFGNLYKAHQSCRKGKRWKDSVAIYDIRGLECTLTIQELLTTGKYRLSPYNCFVINERGKKRDIKSIKYRDRVVQKSLMDNILTPTVTKTFIDTNCASLKGKGTDYALKKLRQHLQRQVRKKGTGGYILACDMKGYFDSIPHELLNTYYESIFEDKWLIGLIRHIHRSIPGGIGVPLGNQLSQLDALLALSPLDHIVKEQMHIQQLAGLVLDGREQGAELEVVVAVDEQHVRLKLCGLRGPQQHALVLPHRQLREIGKEFRGLVRVLDAQQALDLQEALGAGRAVGVAQSHHGRPAPLGHLVRVEGLAPALGQREGLAQGKVADLLCGADGIGGDVSRVLNELAGLNVQRELQELPEPFCCGIDVHEKTPPRMFVL